jgi:hypothetical protein
VAGACRTRTYQSPCDDLSDFEDRASHQARTLPCQGKLLFYGAFFSPIPSRAVFGDPLPGHTSQPSSLANLLTAPNANALFRLQRRGRIAPLANPGSRDEPIAISCGIAPRSLIVYCFLSPSVERSSASNCGRSFAGCPSSWLAQSRCGRCTRGRRACYSPGCTATALHRRGAA